MTNKKGNVTLLTVGDLARGMGISEHEVHRLNNCHEIPAPVSVDGGLRWAYWEIDTWFDEGCPSREGWQYMEMAAKGGA